MQHASVVHIVFALGALLILVCSLGVVLVRNPIRSILLLIGSFLPTSLIYVLLHAPFVGILQVLVYAGAIMMLFTLVIMMINPSPGGGEVPDSRMGEEHEKPLTQVFISLILLAAAGAILLPLAYSAAAGIGPSVPPREGFGSLGAIAELLFRDPANNPLTISFELISFLILVGIIAALNFSRRKAGPRARIDTDPSGTTHSSDGSSPRDALHARESGSLQATGGK